jgi:tight adherence protein C
MTDLTPLFVGLLAFGATGCVAYVVGQHYLRNVRLYSRLPVVQEVGGDSNSAARGIAALVARHFDERRFGVDDTLRGQLRLNLIRAGYFRKDAINFYVFWRLAAVVLLPLVAYFLLTMFAHNMKFTTTAIVIFMAMGLGVIGPDAYVARRQRLMSAEYRIVFPDLLDLMTVCVDAGLSLEGALGRITPEIGKRDDNGRGNAGGANVRRCSGNPGRPSDDTGGPISGRSAPSVGRTRQRCRRGAPDLQR